MEDPSSPFPDLNLIPFPLATPKIEPPDDHHDPSSSSSASAAAAAITNPNLFATEIHPPLQRLSPHHDSEALFAEYLRLAHAYFKSWDCKPPLPSAPTVTPSTSRSLLPTTSTNNSLVPTTTTTTAHNAIVPASKKRKRKLRSAEMVRVSAADHLYCRDAVRRARITYDSLRALLLKRGDGGVRPDLRAAALMTDRDLWLNRDKRIIGPIPGLNVGDVFFFRIELCVLGLHGQVQAGIDYVHANRTSTGEPVATSIIVSGGYEDDDDNGDVLVYTGHGGRQRNAHHHSVAQKLEGGNLALERSLNYGIEIRVVRGIRSDVSPTGKVYVYDGIYKIVHCWVDTGKSGFSVYKYKLVRLQGQPEMGSSIIKLAAHLKLNPLSVRPMGYLSLDISMGKENFPISLFNDIDDERDPLNFEYATRPLYPHFMNNRGGGCACIVNCSTDCDCALRNGGEFAYDGNNILISGKPLIYECSPLCRCPLSCPNRVTQKGIMHPLEIYRSRETGWGVRSLDLIRAGTFICEFSGIVLTKQQAELLSMNRDNLVHPNRFPARWTEWGDVSDVFPDHTPPNFPLLRQLSFAIDVSRAANVACFLSHSCRPNVFVQFVLFDHYNINYPHLMVFAMENIPPLRELSIDYGEVDDSVGRLSL